jgi:predicted nuclease with TOPRIM domain
MFQSIQMEREYYEIRDQFNSTKTALADINNQMAEAVALYKEIKDLKSKIAELESNLEIASLDNQFLKEELDKFREQEALSTNK